MEKIRKRKKECSAKGCRKAAGDDDKCLLHSVVKDSAVTERVVSGHRIKRTAKKISRVRNANEHKENLSRTPVVEYHGKIFEPHAAARRRDGYKAICFSAGKILGRFGSYLEGK